MRLDHLLSREIREARERGAKPEVGTRKERVRRGKEPGRVERTPEGARGTRKKRAAKSRRPERDRREDWLGKDLFFTISFSGIADAP